MGLELLTIRAGERDVLLGRLVAERLRIPETELPPNYSLDSLASRSAERDCAKVRQMRFGLLLGSLATRGR